MGTMVIKTLQEYFFEMTLELSVYRCQYRYVLVTQLKNISYR